MCSRFSFLQCHDDEDEEEHPMADMSPDDHKDPELANALDDTIDVAIVASAHVTKDGKSIE